MQRVLITGASRGIGRAIAVELASPDRHVILHGRDIRALEETANLVHRKGGRFETVVCDLANMPDLEHLTQLTARQPLHVLINNAGVAYVKPVAELTLDNWQRTFAVNVTAPFWLSRKLIPVMPTGASIINILSTASKLPFADWSCYCMSKFALDGFMRSLREELRAKEIRVINIYPAATVTDMWHKTTPGLSSDGVMNPDQVAQAVSFALGRPSAVLIEDITIGNLNGSL